MNYLMINLMVVYIPMLILGLLMPLLTKSTLFFGVNIPEEKYKDSRLRLLRNKYFINFTITSVIIYGLLAYLYGSSGREIYVILGPFAFIILLFFNYYYIHNKVKALKGQEKWFIDKKQVVIVDTKVRPNERAISPWWFLIPAAICLFGILFTMIQYPHLPDKLPGHFNALGEVTRYDNKSLISAFMIPMTKMLLTVMMFGIYKVMSNARIAVNPSKPKLSLLRGQLANRRWGIFALFMAILMNLQLLYTQLMVLQLVDSRWSMAVTISMVVAVLGLVVFIGATTGQGGSRIKLKEEQQETENNRLIARDDDSYWKLGMLYYNPDDPTLWVEKRFGIGMTINHAHPIGKLLTVVIIVFLLGSLVLPMIL